MQNAHPQKHFTFFTLLKKVSVKPAKDQTWQPLKSRTAISKNLNPKMQRFDYLGDAVWSIAWRLFEAENFIEHTGWHRTFRSQIVNSNRIMSTLAILEKIQPIGEDEKRFADGLEHVLGAMAQHSILEAIAFAQDIMKRRLKVAVMNKTIKATIKKSLMVGKKLHPQITIKFIRMTETESLLGELF